MIRLLPVQTAIYQALISDAPLMAMLPNGTDSVIEEPDQNQAAPYITLGEQTGTPDDLLIETGGQQTNTLHVWDHDAPVSRIKAVMDRAIQVLHNARLTIVGTQLVQCIVEYTEVMRDQESRHGVIRVRVVTFG